MTRVTVASVFGTRPETIKMAPILRELALRAERIDSRVILTSQHTSLIEPLLRFFDIRADIDLNILKPGQSLGELLGRLVTALDQALLQVRPDVVVVQGDTTSALAGAMAAHHHKIPVVHVEAGLRSGDRYSPFPEEMNRRLVTQLASLHMAATPGNADNLIAEGIDPARIVVTGNPVVDALEFVLKTAQPSSQAQALLKDLESYRVIALTTHRRENFGHQLQTYLRVLGQFVASHADTALIFPVHPNPAVMEACRQALPSSDRIRLIEPMNYPDFLHVLKACWLIASDSGGIQEEAPSLGKPLIILRQETERPEVVACGAARLVGAEPENLMQILEETYSIGDWADNLKSMQNPFGRGDAATRIVSALESLF